MFCRIARLALSHLPKERVEALGLVDGNHLVGRLPEEDADGDGGVDLGDHVEERAGPVGDDLRGSIGLVRGENSG